MYSWLHWVFRAVCRLSLVAASSSYSLDTVLRLLTAVASHVAEPLGPVGTVVVAHWLSFPWHVKSSRTRERTCVPFTGRWVLNHWTTREA